MNITVGSARKIAASEAAGRARRDRLGHRPWPISTRVHAVLFAALAAALILLGSTAAALAANAATGANFLRLAIRGDIAEIRLGQLAQQKSQNTDVKSFGQMLVADHTQARSEQEALATTLNDKVPKKEGWEDRQEFQKLSALSGVAFDREFIRAMVVGHQTTVSVFQMEAKTSDVQVAALAQKELPTLQKHLAMAQSLQAKLGQPAAQ